MTLTPKEKAKELVHKFYLVNSESVELTTGEHDLLFSLNEIDAKECAVINVNEIIESRKDDRRFDDTLIQGSSGYASLHPMGLSYWLEVKKEIPHVEINNTLITNTFDNQKAEIMSDKNQMSVEWLSKQAYVLIEQYSERKFDRITLNKLMFEATDKAKEMEKEQHATTWDKAMDNLDARGGNMVRAWVDFDDYYNETYGGGNL
jgi:hypothetical protein